MDIRNDIYSKFLENDLFFFEQYKIGDLVSRLSADVGVAKSAISNNLTWLIKNLIIIFTSFIVIFLINFKLACMVAILIPIYLMISSFYNKRSKKLVRAARDN